MPIDSDYNSLSQMMRIKPLQEGPQSASGERGEAVTASHGRLAQLADRISLSSVGPDVKRQLESIAEQGGNVAPVLEDNISQLQDVFIEELQGIMNEAGISLDDKLTLHLQADSLQVAGAHPDRQRVDELLASSPDLSGAFRELAAQSELVRDLNSIRNAVGAASASQRYHAQSAMGGGEYRVSMKGAMAHFYFSN